MMDDEKKCPLTKMTCYGAECALWCFGECGLALQARKIDDMTNDLYLIRKALEENL